MTEERELKIPIEEANKISIQCRCGAELVVDTLKYTQWTVEQLRCSICSTYFHANLVPVLRCLSEAQQKSELIRNVETPLFLRISIASKH
jgi:uncharacterized paraquat-inducible protein A